MVSYNINDLLNAVYATMKRFGGQHLWWRGQAAEEWTVFGNAGFAFGRVDYPGPGADTSPLPKSKAYNAASPLS